MKLSLLVLPSASLFVLTPAFAPAPILEEAALSDVTLQVDGEFGDAVAISGDTMAVVAFQHDLSAHNAGAAFVYSRVGGAWVLQAVLTHPTPRSSDIFGASVAIDGTRIVVGAPLDDSSSTGTMGGPSDGGAPGSGAVLF